MICNKCGAEYPDTETKCPQCDTETVVAEESAETVQEISEVEETVVEEIEEFAPSLPVKKSKKGLWIIIAAAAVILAATVAAFGIASNMYYTSASDENASVYVITKKEMDRVYAKVGSKEAYLVKELGDNETFSENSEFVVKNNNIYFLNDDGGLSIMNMKNGKTREIGIDFKAGTLVLSAKGDTVLFVGEDGCLYKSTKGRQAKNIADVGGATFENTLPSYGFVEGTNKVWYSPVDEKYSADSVYLESGDCIAEKVSSVFYVGDEGKTVVYTTVTDEKIIEQEPVTNENGEEVQPEPVVVKSYALMIKEAEKEPAVLNDKYEATDSVSILNKDRKGVLYLADKGEAPSDPETGEVIGTAVGTLYFHEFNGETITLETEVSVALLLAELNGSNYWYDASDRAEDETIAYMKNNTIALIRDMKVIENPAEFEFLSSAPMFGNKNTFMIYKTYNPTPVKEETDETDDAEEADNPEETEATPVKLVYTELVDGVWSEYTAIAENVIDFKYDEDNRKIYYLLDEKEDTQNLVLYCHDVKTKENVKIAEDVLGYMTSTDKGKNFYYVNGFDSETQTASFSLYNGKKVKVVAEGLSGCMVASSGTPYIVISNNEDSDLYYISGDKTELVCKKMTNILYGR